MFGPSGAARADGEPRRPGGRSQPRPLAGLEAWPFDGTQARLPPRASGGRAPSGGRARFEKEPRRLEQRLRSVAALQSRTLRLSSCGSVHPEAAARDRGAVGDPGAARDQGAVHEGAPAPTPAAFGGHGGQSKPGPAAFGGRGVSPTRSSCSRPGRASPPRGRGPGDRPARDPWRRSASPPRCGGRRACGGTRARAGPRWRGP